MRMLFIIISSILAGIVLTLVVQFVLFRRWFRFLPVVTSTWKPQTESSLLPKELQEALKDTKSDKATCACLNLMFQFLFQELKDTKRIRRWAMNRMKLEFEEMLRSTTGKLLEHISVRDFNLGRTFPIIRGATVNNVSVNEDNMVEEVTLLLDLTYNGRFQLAVDVDMVFGKSAYLSVILTKLQGTARLQFTRLPYTHWSFAFTEDPILDFEVESHFEGRPVAQLTSIIINQIRKSVRKKHTLPSYKIRYRPFFVKPTAESPQQDVYYHGNKISVGRLRVVVVGCTRLANVVVQESLIYCSLALDTIQWMELLSFRHKLWMAHEVELTKTPGQNVGLSFGEVFLLDKYEEMVVVTAVIPASSAAKADIQKNDLLVAVNGVKVTSSKHAVRLIKSSAEKVKLRMERAIKGYSDINRRTSAPASNVEDDANDPKAINESCNETSTSIPNGDSETVDGLASLISSANYAEKSLTESNSIVKTNADRPNGGDGRPRSASAVPSSLPPPPPLPLFPPPSSSASPPVVKKSLTQLLNSGSVLFQRKRQKADVAPAPTKGGSPRAVGGSAKEMGERTADPKSSPKTETGSVADAGSSALERKEKKMSLVDANLPVAPKDDHQLNRNQEDVSADNIETKFKESGAAASKPSFPPPLPPPPPAVAAAAVDDVDDGGCARMRTTRTVTACCNPVFSEKFDFDVEDKHNYLNLCVWLKQPEKLDKQSRIVKPEKDVLLGHISIPLMDVALECLTTLQGDTTNTFNLTPSDSKVETGRTPNSNLASHSGFDERLCHGDVTLRFTYMLDSLSRKERDSVEKMSHENEENGERPSMTIGRTTDAERFQIRSTVPLVAGQHNFVVTHFQTVTYCNFCSKKIWLKTAFQCQLCHMVCHKKCTARCQAQMKCSRLLDGSAVKNDERPAKTSKQDTTRNATDSSVEKGIDRELKEEEEEEETAGLLEGSESSNGGGGEVERKRHNSAPDENISEESETGISLDELHAVTALPRTRSSTSLIELPPKEENAMQQTANVKCIEDDENLSKILGRVKRSSNSDERVVTAAKRMGKELYAHLDPLARKEKLDCTILRLQGEIDGESERRSELVAKERSTTDRKLKTSLKDKLEKSDEKIQSMTVLMLHYCAGLQHCLDQEEQERQKRAEERERTETEREPERKEEETEMRNQNEERKEERAIVESEDDENEREPKGGRNRESSREEPASDEDAPKRENTTVGRCRQPQMSSDCVTTETARGEEKRSSSDDGGEIRLKESLGMSSFDIDVCRVVAAVEAVGERRDPSLASASRRLGDDGCGGGPSKHDATSTSTDVAHETAATPRVVDPVEIFLSPHSGVAVDDGGASSVINARAPPPPPPSGANSASAADAGSTNDGEEERGTSRN